MSKGLVYKRILLKFSGEALAGDTKYGIAPAVLDRIVSEIGELINLGVEVGVVVGGGNLFRGETLSAAGIGRITGDHMGMLATLMNALALRDACERAGFEARVMSAIPMSGIVDHYDRRKAIYHLSHGEIVIFAGGTGNPLVTTDSAASLRAIETEADVLLKATGVDGIYDDDPAKNPDANLYTRLSYREALQKELGVMDLAAFTQCRDHDLKIIVFNTNKEGALLRVVTGEDEGTLVE
ncbi:MAG: UMP kinase [Coxiellaceae bacterium]|nr:UMP kinase [Coxiellaceae bacterium]